MASRKNKPIGNHLRPSMVKHIRALGLESDQRYFAWCRNNGFEPSVDKSLDQRVAELALPQQQAARANQHQRLHHNPRKFLHDSCAGKIVPEDIQRLGWTRACQAIAATDPDTAHRNSLCDFLVGINRKAGFVFGHAAYGRQTLHYIDGLINLHNRQDQWLRKIEDWRPKSHNMRRQFASLVRHLLARYPVPAFMDSAWMRQDTGSWRFRDWYIHIGSGQNIRTAKLLFPMTKIMAHHFLQAPGAYSIEEALLWSDVHALGGGESLTEALLATRIGNEMWQDGERRDFWCSVYRFFIANPMLDNRHVGPIVDYLYFQKYQEHEVLTGPGQVEVRQPPQPNLSMNRRTPEALLRQVERWHGSLATLNAAANRYFRASGFPGLTLASGEEDKSGKRPQWRIRELLSGDALVTEGRLMRHCVASYAWSCADGRCSIWTLERRQTNGKVLKHLTLELAKTGILVQARGQNNRLPTQSEMDVLDRWVRKAGLRKGRFFDRI